MWRSRALASVAALVAGVLAALALAAPAAADVDDFTFDSFDADYTLTRDESGTSHLAVTETIVAVFPETDQNRGIRRQIPDTYNGQPVNAQLVSITDENGAARPAEIEDVDGAFSVVSRADDYVHGPQTYVIAYTLENVTWNFADTGQGHQDEESACPSIARTDDADGGAVITAEASDLAPYETLTMAVGFAPGTFTVFDASYLASPLGWLQGLAGLGAIGGALLAIRARRRALADEPGRPTIIAEYTPPTSVDALESAVLLGRNPTAIPAEVLEQAVVGSIRIVEGERRWMGKPKLVAELVDPSRADGDGTLLLRGLFPAGVPGERYEFGRQDTRFSSAAQKILAAADKELTARGMRRTVPSGTRLWPVLIAAATTLLAFGLGIAAIDRNVNPAVPVVVIVVSALALVAVIILVARRPLTALGAETRDHLRGLETFIAWAEADRIRMLQSPTGAERVPVDVDDPRQKLALYERLLPYAVVFGQEKQWSKELAVLYTAVGAAGPYWYVGSSAFDASSFAASVGSLSSAASSSSSTSGGSSGGGSAGGGGGGGGGGGV